MKQYKDDLLASCLHLLLSLPQQLVQVNITALIPALQVLYIVVMATGTMLFTGRLHSDWAGVIYH